MPNLVSSLPEESPLIAESTNAFQVWFSIQDCANQLRCLPLTVISGTTVREAVDHFCIQYPQYAYAFNSLAEMEFGIFSAKAQQDTILHPHDRIEYYQALIFDPMESRRRRAEKDTKERKKFTKRRFPHKQNKKPL